MISPLVRALRMAYWAIAWLFVIAVLVQTSFVGLTLFAGQSLWETHVAFGHLIGVLTLLNLILAFAARLPRPAKIQALSLFALYVLQAEVFAVVRETLPLPAALHPVLALALFWLAVTVALEARAFAQAPSAATAEAS